MGEREHAKALLELVPDYKMCCVIAYLQGLTAYEEAHEKPNAQTVAAIEELENGGGMLFTGSTKDFFAQLMEEED